MQDKILVPTHYPDAQYYRLIGRDASLKLSSKMLSAYSDEDPGGRDGLTFQEHYRCRASLICLISN